MRFKITLTLLALTLFALHSVAAQQTAQQAARVERIGRIENGLLPPVVVKGNTQPLKLVEQMAKYKVPGVSVAVIQDGKRDPNAALFFLKDERGWLEGQPSKGKFVAVGQGA